MLKIHSFLQKVKQPIHKILPNNIGKYKTRMAVIAYAMVTVLFILSPDYIYGKSNNGVKVYAKAEIMHLSAKEIEEETANEAIIRTNQNNLDSKFILCNLATDGSPMGYKEEQTLKLLEEGILNNSTVLSLDYNNSEDTTEVDSKADSQQIGADAKEKVDSSSANEKENQNTDEVDYEMTNTAPHEITQEATQDDTKTTQDDTKATTQDTADTKQETEKSATQNTEVLDISSKDIKILQRIVEAEATGEDIKGKILVANVILNRVNDEAFPNTIEGVVFQQDGDTYQFSPIRDNRYWSVEITKDTKTAVKRVIQGEDYSKGALYFSARARADKSSMRWFDNNLKFLFEYGGHEFFKNK